MSETKTAVEPVEQESNAMIPIEQLGFVRTRLTTNRKDRTVDVVRIWQTLFKEVITARQETLSCCEAVEDTRGVVTFRVLDRRVFDGLQAMIRSHDEQIAALEAAIRKLDATGVGWHQDLADKVFFLGDAETSANARLAKWAGWHINRSANSGLGPDEILAKDPEYQRVVTDVRQEIADAKAEFGRLKPKLDEIEAILTSVGC